MTATSDFPTVNEATGLKVGQRESGEIISSDKTCYRALTLQQKTYAIPHKLLPFLVTRHSLFCLTTYLSDAMMSTNTETAKSKRKQTSWLRILRQECIRKQHSRHDGQQDNWR